MPAPSALWPEGGLLRPFSDDFAAMDFDLFGRYAEVAKQLSAVLADHDGPVSVLEVGCNIHNVLPRLLDPDRVRVTRCDVDPVTDGPDFVLIPRDPPMPFADGQFHAVVALEVLEHLPRARRQTFLADCLRVAQRAAVFSCPIGTPEAVAAEAVARSAFHWRRGIDHPFLAEHAEFGLPAPGEIEAILDELGINYFARDDAPLEQWLPMLLLSETVKELLPGDDWQRRLNEAWVRGHLPDVGGACYRKIFVCDKSPRRAGRRQSPVAFDGIEPNHGGLTHPRSPQAMLQTLATSAARAIVALDTDHLDQRRRELALNRQLLDEFRQYHAVANSFVQGVLTSAWWKWMGIARELKRLTRPNGFDGSALFPWRDLDADPRSLPGTYTATGTRPTFLTPCLFPAGWLRVDVRMTCDVNGRQGIYAVHADGLADIECLETAPVHGTVERTSYFHLQRPALAILFEPIDRPGRFQLVDFRVQSLSPPAALLRAIRRKSELLTKHGLLGRALRNAAGQLLRGRFGEVRQKVFAALRGGQASEVRDGVCRLYGPTAEERFARPSRPDRAANIVYVLKSAGLCGGVKVVLEHASRLYERGHNVCVYFLDNPPDWFNRPVPAVQYVTAEAMEQSLTEFRGIKVATWYETAPWVANSLRDGDRGYYLVQDIEEGYCSTPDEVNAVRSSYRLPLTPITEGDWVRRQLHERFARTSVHVGIGLDLDMFRERPVPRDPKRVLTQARTWSGGARAGSRIKGFDTTFDVLLRLHERLGPGSYRLDTFSIESAPRFPAGLIHEHHQTPSDERLAELYNRAGIYLMTSRHEGFGLPAAEAMACGAAVVATRADGNEEFCRDGVTALTADIDDAETLTRHCQRLLAEPGLARELAAAGRDFISGYTWDKVIDKLEREFIGAASEIPVIDKEQPKPDSEVAAPSPVTLNRTRNLVPTMNTGEYPDLRLPRKALADWTFVIPTINDVRLTEQCVTTCRRYLPRDRAAEFIVIDDGTRDAATRQQLRQAAKELDFRLRFNGQNLGFSASVNRGLRHAKGRFIALCNNDIVFNQCWMRAVEAAFADDDRIGVIGVKLLYPDGTIQHAGMDKVPGKLEWHHAHGRRPGDWPASGENRLAWSVTGALFVIRREALRALGGFSTAYGTAYEDLDYCLHAWSNGVRVGYCGAAVATHLEGGTRGATDAEKRQKSPLWSARERAGRAYFETKWAALRDVNGLDELIASSAGRPSLGPADDFGAVADLVTGVGHDQVVRV